MTRKNKPAFILVTLMFIILTLGPIVWCFIVSISPESEMFSSTTQFLPDHPTLHNYYLLLDLASHQSQTFMKGVGNSLKAAVLTLLMGLPISLLAAYALSRLEFKGQRFIRTALLITLVIPVFTTIIPLYAMFTDLKLLDNIFWLSAVYVSSFLPIITWVLSNYIATIPKELDEAALLDGCGRVRTFTAVILPNLYPIIFAVILMMFLMTWNQYQIPLILASSGETKPLGMIIVEFTSKDAVQYGITAAAGMIAILPPALIAILFRKSLILGLSQGAVKG